MQVKGTGKEAGALWEINMEEPVCKPISALTQMGLI